MSINSLANFGTPGLAGEREASLQPILTTHWRALVYSFGSSGETAPYDMTRQIKTVSLPSVQFSPITIYNYVSAVYIQSRGEWSEGQMSVLDDITNSARRRVENQIAKQKNFFDQTMSRAGENYKFEMDIDILAGGATAGNSAADPNIIRKYCYAGCMLTSVDDGQMSYDSATPKEITIGFRYDNVTVFDHTGARMGTFSHTNEIQSQSGTAAIGTGIQGNLGTTSGFSHSALGSSLTFA